MLRTKTPGVQGVADAPLGVVVVGDLGAGDAGGDEAVRYSSIRSGATSKATWFMEPMALVRSPWSGRAAGALIPGTPSGASGNQKKARQSPPPQSKKKCCPMPAGSSIVLTSGMPSTFV